MTTEAEAIAKLAQDAAAKARIIMTEDDREILIVPNEFNHYDVTPAHKFSPLRPDFISQKVVLQTTDSLVEYVNRFKTDASMLFADINASCIVAQIDYHEPHDDYAGRVAHVAVLQLALSVEWTDWNKISGKLMPQLDFARFIEEHDPDIRAPTGADLLECVRDLQGHRKVNFAKAVRTSTGNESFEWSDQTEVRTKSGSIEVPTKFKLGIPVYFGEPDTDLFAFLRWHLDPPALALGIELHRAEHVRQAVFRTIVMRIAERTECVAVFGKI